jgi:CheY-like chemotaxis protein
MSRVLKREGIEVETALDGFSALKMMKQSFYTMVIMDVQMPIMDGIEATIIIRNELKLNILRRLNSTLNFKISINEAFIQKSEGKINTFISKISI